MASAGALDELFQAIAAQRRVRPRTTRVAKLLGQDVKKMAKKLGEEAIETGIAAAAGTRMEVVQESADLLFRLLILWAKLKIEPARAIAELTRRHGSKLGQP